MKQVFLQPEGPTIKILRGVLNRNASPISIPLGIPSCFSVGSVVFGEFTRVIAGDKEKSTRGSLLEAI